jgi:hypothetical protein
MDTEGGVDVVAGLAAWSSPATARCINGHVSPFAIACRRRGAEIGPP